MTRSWIPVVRGALTAAVALLAMSAVFARGAAAQPAADAVAVPSASYDSPMRAQCNDELRKDVRWKAELRQELTPQIHQQDADEMLRNKQHVVYAYAALWIFMLGFVVYMWRKNVALTGDVARLEREIRAAVGPARGATGSEDADK